MIKNENKNINKNNDVSKLYLDMLLKRKKEEEQCVKYNIKKKRVYEVSCLNFK